MKNKLTAVLISSFLIFSCCSLEERIKEYSYTEHWYLENGVKHQVYKTKKGQYYIIVLNKKETKEKRKYIKL